MSRIDFYDRMRVPLDDRGVEVCGLEKPGKDGLARGGAVDGQPREFTDPAPLRAKLVDFRAIKLVGGQPPLVGIDTQANGSHDLALVVGDERQDIGLRFAAGDDIAAPLVSPLDYRPDIPVRASALGEPYLEGAQRGGRILQGGQ